VQPTQSPPAVGYNPAVAGPAATPAPWASYHIFAQRVKGRIRPVAPEIDRKRFIVRHIESGAELRTGASNAREAVETGLYELLPCPNPMEVPPIVERRTRILDSGRESGNDEAVAE
jgi:hypothetical protein